ncbi:MULTISPECIES: D-alanyl-D-alanine carboxypeptidase family protein [Caproicibacterium]|uniref:serine-type D-Ala-D-Ala carboxypeptidase n=1 Tax=Caproicibacterium argilliputei TaxID=3030016 RepID=A0AA97H035_9FIRM|nr:D-alanyl-D-alanine carboxypeptidase family protein [Caproicibacterium argilliputei]WOC31063.1 D-alanyl-D-alanine carboxypeptidase family protein [Caproicibacterium argilliputei]
MMKFKKIAAAVLAVALATAVVPMRAYALDEKKDIRVPAAVLMEASTGQVLYEKASHEKRACASITKVMTLLLVMEALDSGKIHLNDMVSTSAHASSMGGSDIWLKEGETMSVNDMIKATVVASANDAAVALAEYIAGSDEAFVEKMNAKAKTLGMKDTVFKNCNGLDAEGHVTSAYDVALMSRALIQHKKIFDYTSIWMDTLRGGKTQIVNTNKLLKSYKGITGLKTGTTSGAGSCISATAERSGLSLIAVALGASNTKDRFAAATTLLNYGFAGWAMTSLSKPSGELTPVPVENGMSSQVSVQTDFSGQLLVPKGKEKAVAGKITLQQSVQAPVQKGQKLGEVTYTLDGKVLCTRPVTAVTSVSQMSFSRVLRLLLMNLWYV